MIMIGEWSWSWSANDHDQRTPIMGAVCCVWSLIRANNWDSTHKTANSKKPAACGTSLSIAISERVLKPRPALWSSELILTTGTFLWPDPVLRRQQPILNPHKIQIWFKLQDQFWPPWRGVAIDNTDISFLQKNANFNFLFLEGKVGKFCQQSVATLKPGCEAGKQAKPEQMCDKDRALDNVTCDTSRWHVTYGGKLCDNKKSDNLALLIKSVRECDSCCILLSNL